MGFSMHNVTTCCAGGRAERRDAARIGLVALAPPAATFYAVFGNKLLLITLCLCASLTHAQNSNDLPALEGLVRQWVELRTQIATENRAWQEQERQWQTEIALLEKEHDALKQEIATASHQQQSHDQEQLALTARQEHLDAVLEKILPTLDQAEAALRSWQANIPPPLLGPLAESFQRLPETHEASLQISTPRRLQLVVALYAQIEELGHSAHVVKQVLDDGQGGRREMDVLYLGLARAFAVTPDGSTAAIGTPTADGWSWQARPEIAEQVRSIVAVQRRERPASLIPLPMFAVGVAE